MPRQGITRRTHLRYLPEEQVASLHQAVLQVLEETGLRFEDPWALSFLAKQGCAVDEAAGRVRFPRATRRGMPGPGAQAVHRRRAQPGERPPAGRRSPLLLPFLRHANHRPRHARAPPRVAQRLRRLHPGAPGPPPPRPPGLLPVLRLRRHARRPRDPRGRRAAHAVFGQAPDDRLLRRRRVVHVPDGPGRRPRDRRHHRLVAAADVELRRDHLGPPHRRGRLRPDHRRRRDDGRHRACHRARRGHRQHCRAPRHGRPRAVPPSRPPHVNRPFLRAAQHAHRLARVRPDRRLAQQRALQPALVLLRSAAQQRQSRLRHRQGHRVPGRLRKGHRRNRVRALGRQLDAAAPRRVQRAIGPPGPGHPRRRHRRHGRSLRRRRRHERRGPGRRPDRFRWPDPRPLPQPPPHPQVVAQGAVHQRHRRLADLSRVARRWQENRPRPCAGPAERDPRPARAALHHPVTGRGSRAHPAGCRATTMRHALNFTQLRRTYPCGIAN